MNHQQYIAALRQALRGMNRRARDEIVQEIETHIKEMPEESSLLDKFGTPAELASQYMEGEIPVPSVGKKAFRMGRTILIVLGSTALVVVIAAVGFVSYYNRDAFDYSDEAAAQLNDSTLDWNQVDWQSSVSINVEQSKVVFYWHARDTLSWHCKGNSNIGKFQEGTLSFRHNDCIIFLPQYMTALTMRQGNVVLVRPQADIQVKVTQGKLRIAENDAVLRYEITAVRSDIGNFRSDDSAQVLIAVEATESTVSEYEY